MKKLLVLFILFFCVLFLIAEEAIVEEMDVDWWVVPLFAVDKQGESVNQLTEKDIELFVNKKKIESFILYKRPFNVTEEELKKTDIPVVKKKIVFLIFDIAIRSKSNQDKAKEIAKDLIEKSDSSTQFVLMILDPFAGLQYVFGPSNKKTILNDLIEKRVEMLPRSRNPFIVISMAGKAQIVGRSGIGGSRDKYTAEETRFHAEEMATGLKNTDQNFFFSFESLYYSLNQIRDNKFIYLFSEGLTYYARKSVRHVEGEYYKNLKRSAEYMGKSGAVIFVVDPTGFGVNDAPLRSGEDSLKYLAQESGGKYLRGDQKSISAKLEKMNRSYYELAFSDSELFKGKIRRIQIKPRSKDIRIISLKTMEKKKSYSDMSVIEKELLAMNLIDANLFFDSPLKVTNLKIIKSEITQDKKSVTMKIPGKFKEKKLDIFKLWINEDVKVDSIVEKTKVLAVSNKIKAEIKKVNGIFGKLVIIDEAADTAYVQGDNNNSLKDYLKKAYKKFSEKRIAMSEADTIKLNEILIKSADYSRRLENTAFHYFCKEEIVETLSEANLIREQTESKYDYRAGRMISKRVPGKVKGNVLYRKKNRMVFDYQLLLNGDKIVEQRKPFGKTDKKVLEPNLQLNSFISRKIVLTPVSILSWMNQRNYDFRIEKIQKFRGVEIAILEVFPKNLKSIQSVFGRIFIELEDHSVMRMEINPGSVGGFEKIINLSKRLGSSIELKCSIDFDLKRDGVRYPSMVKISEIYKGGNYLKHILKTVRWERSKVTYKYSDYKFFDVDTEVKIQK